MDEQKLTKIVIDSYVKGYEDALRNVSKGATEYFDTERVLEIFGDIDYAWELLEGEVNLETSENIGGEDVSHLLQLYMV